MSQLKTVDPVEMATASTGKKSRGQDKKLPEVTIAEKFRSVVHRFVTDSKAKKTAEAMAKTAHAEILNWAKGEFVKRLLVNQPGNFMITNGEESIQFIVQARGRSYGDEERKTLVEGFGESAARLLEPEEDISLNLEVWDQHKATLVAALNAVDANGQRLVHDDILKALFYRPMRVKASVIEGAINLAEGNEAKLTKLLFEELNLVCSLSAK